jgi:hypothetical protein
MLNQNVYTQTSLERRHEAVKKSCGIIRLNPLSGGSVCPNPMDEESTTLNAVETIQPLGCIFGLVCLPGQAQIELTGRGRSGSTKDRGVVRK